MKLQYAFQIFLMSALPVFCWASEPVQAAAKFVSIDVEGNGQQQVLQIMYSGVEPGITRFVVKYGKYKFTNDYVSSEGDFPIFKSISVGAKASRKLLLVETPQPAGCFYDVYSFRAGRGFYRVFKYFENMCEYKPKFSGSGDIIVGEWQGFWMKEIKYVYQKSSDLFKIIEAEEYPVSVSGKSPKNMSGSPFEGENDDGFKVGQGELMAIVSYWPAKKKYLVQKRTGQKGWLSEADVAVLVGLPWAG